MRQEDKLEAYLAEFGQATKQEILRDLGIWNSGECVRRIRRRLGYHSIRTDMEESGACKFAVYVWTGGAQTELAL